MAETSYYQLLGIERDADEAAIKSAYRKLAKQYHPDRNPGDAAAESRFKDINEAYEVLKDKQSRAAYDSLGHAAFQAQKNGGMGGMGGMGAGMGGMGGAGFSSMSDVFGNIFDDILGAQTRRRTARPRGEDLRYDMPISLEEAYAGKRADIAITAPVLCDACAGSGAAAGTHPIPCPACNGSGRQRTQQGFFTIERPCPQCRGRGESIASPCPQCSGAGQTRKQRRISVDIPAGIENGTRIRLAGEGAPPPRAAAGNASPGDLYIFVSVRPHSLFERQGADLFCRVPVAMTTAALGGDIEIPGLQGQRLKIKIPEGCQGGHRLRLRGKGMSVLRSREHGDLYVEVNVETPRRLSKKQKELLAAFAAESGATTSPEASGFFEGLKNFFATWREARNP